MRLNDFLRQKIADGETQSSISRKCKISQSTVNNFLQGQESPRTSTLRKIADAYNLPLSYFIHDTTYTHFTTTATATEPLTGCGVQAIHQKLSPKMAEICAKIENDPIMIKMVTDLLELDEVDLAQAYADHMKLWRDRK